MSRTNALAEYPFSDVNGEGAKVYGLTMTFHLDSCYHMSCDHGNCAGSHCASKVSVGCGPAVSPVANGEAVACHLVSAWWSVVIGGETTVYGRNTDCAYLGITDVVCEV